MAFKSIGNNTAKAPKLEKLGFFTKERRGNTHGREFHIKFKAAFLEECGIEPGDRCMVEVDKWDSLVRVAKGGQNGWLIKPVTKGSQQYLIRAAWSPDLGLPIVDQLTEVDVLQRGEGEVIFKLPKGDAK